MNELTSFYNTLLSIEVTVFGIISAVILVFIQIVYSNFSFKHMRIITRDIFMIMFFVISVFDLIFTATGSYILSFPNFTFYIYKINLTELVNRSNYVFICLIMLIFSSILFAIFLWRNIKYLQPKQAIFLLVRKTKIKEIQHFLWKKYGFEIPWSLQRPKIVFDIPVGEDEEINSENNSEDEEKENEKKLSKIETEIKYIKKQIRKTEDSLLPLRDMMIQFIKKSDLRSLTEATSSLVAISSAFFEKLPNNDEQEWSPYDNLCTNYSIYIVDFLEHLFEIANKEESESAIKLLLEFLSEFSLLAINNMAYAGVENVVELLFKVADDSIGESSLIFQDTIDVFQEIIRKVIKSVQGNPINQNRDGRKDLLDTIFIKFSSLSDHVCEKEKRGKVSLRGSSSDFSEITILFNFILSMENLFSVDQPHTYPLVYFDFLIVMLKRLMDLFDTERNQYFENHIYTISYSFLSFTESALKVKNIDGASLAVLRLNEAFSYARSSGLNKVAKDIIGLLVRLGYIAAGNNVIDRCTLLNGQTIESWVTDVLVKSGVNVESEIQEIHFHIDEVNNHEASWQYIVNLGKRLGTNFGLMFDFETGIIYSDDDPRRM